MRRTRLALYVLGMLVVFLLPGAVEIASATHTATIDNDPDIVGPGDSVNFTLTVTNDGGSTHSINTVILTPNSNFQNWNALTPPSGWTATEGLSSIRWRTTTSPIAPGNSLSFDWTATAPTTTGDYTSNVQTKDTNGDSDYNSFVTTVQPIPEFPLGLVVAFAAGLVVYTSFKKLNKSSYNV